MALTTLVVAVALGIAAQIVAERFQLPAILPLLVLGILCGPSGMGWFVPSSLGETLQVLIHLGVAVILFEGGLSLDPARLREVGGAVRNLVTIGVVITGVGAAWLAHTLLGVPWQIAALFGAIMTVTGPTVVVPLLHHMIAPREMKAVLVAEGLITDPVGAVLAYLALQWIERTGAPWRMLFSELVAVGITGAVLGFVAGSAANWVVRHRLVSGELRNLAVLSLVMVCYLASEAQAEQAGILAVVVMGFTMSAAELPDLVSLKAFKGQLTTLLISVLFILLAGQLDLLAVVQLGWGGLLVIGGLVFLVRPAAVVASVWPGMLSWRERVVLSMTAPRGIVAAAVASLAARQLNAAGVPGGGTLEGLVYLAIIITGGWATLVSVTFPALLGFTKDPTRRRVVVVGANPFTEVLAGLLAARGRSVGVIDAVAWRLERFRKAGHQVVTGDARQAEAFQEAGVERDTVVVAATTNDELNLLVAQKLHSEFGVEHPVAALQEPPDEMGRRSLPWVQPIGGGAMALPDWIRRLESHQVRLLEVRRSEESAAALREVERERPGEVLRLVAWKGSQPVFDVDSSSAESLTLLVHEGPALEALAVLNGQVVELPNGASPVETESTVPAISP